MPKKILICEDEKIIAGELSARLNKRGYETAVLADKNIDYIIDNLGRIVEKEKPDYVLIDGLYGRWMEASEIAVRIKSDTLPIIISAEEYVIEHAKKLEYIVFDKLKLNESNGDLELLDILDRKQKDVK